MNTNNLEKEEIEVIKRIINNMLDDPEFWREGITKEINKLENSDLLKEGEKLGSFEVGLQNVVFEFVDKLEKKEDLLNDYLTIKEEKEKNKNKVDKHKIDIDIFKKVTGNYFLNNDEGQSNDVITIVGNACFLNRKLLGSVSHEDILEMMSLQDKRNSKKGEIIND